MRKQARNTIEQFHMFPRGAKVIVGLSGGADSVALLHILCSLKAEFFWDITAVHIHHGLRGEDADKDARFAAEFCKKLGVPCVIRRFDVKAEAKKRKLGEEETGRLLRYVVFRELAGEDGFIAVAHHRQDQAETVLMRLCRGTGLQGLVGMRPVRENVCRPLLFCSRGDIEAYCGENGLDWREDASNQEEIYTRNKLRLKVLPLLQEINPKAAEHIAETAELLALEEDFLEEQAENTFAAVRRDGSGEEVCLDRANLAKLHPALRKRVLRKAMGEFLSADVSQVQIDALEDLLAKETGRSRDFLNGIHAENRYDLLVLSLKKEQAEGYQYALSVGEKTNIPERGISVSLWVSDRYEKHTNDTKCFDFAKCEDTFFCRTRKRGDMISLKTGRKKMKDLFIDEKVPRAEREMFPLITAGEEILWAAGLRVSAKHLPDEKTEKYLYVRIEKA